MTFLMTPVDSNVFKKVFWFVTSNQLQDLKAENKISCQICELNLVLLGIKWLLQEHISATERIKETYFLESCFSFSWWNYSWWDRYFFAFLKTCHKNVKIKYHKNALNFFELHWNIMKDNAKLDMITFFIINTFIFIIGSSALHVLIINCWSWRMMDKNAKSGQKISD